MQIVGMFENHKTDARVRQIDVACCLGGERNNNPSNDNPLIILKATKEGNKKNVATRTFTRPRNELFVEEDVGITLGASHNMSPLNNRYVVVCFSKRRKNAKQDS